MYTYNFHYEECDDLMHELDSHIANMIQDDMYTNVKVYLILQKNGGNKETYWISVGLLLIEVNVNSIGYNKCKKMFSLGKHIKIN